MKNHSRQTHCFLLLLLLCFTSCKGQVNKNLPLGSTSQPKTTTNGQPKLIKTQGTGPGANVCSVVQDNAGDLWFGTTGEGIYRYDGKEFTHYTVKDGLSNNNVWCVYVDKTGSLWAGTADGLCRFDGKKFTTVPIYGTGSSKFYVYPGGAPSVENAVWSILQDKTGGFWFGTTKGLYRYNGKVFTRFLQDDSIHNQTGFQINAVEAVLEDRGGNIWFGGGVRKACFVSMGLRCSA